MNSMFLVIVDAHSKWVEIFKTNSATSETTIQCLRNTFARFGIPQTIVSDNGTSFTSQEFQDFTSSNGITHVTTAPYNPQSNGLAERMVQTFKSGMRKLTEGTVETKLVRFLLNYRTTPHSTTRMTPAELMFGRQLRTRFYLLHPELNVKIERKQQQQKKNFNRNVQQREFTIGDYVFVRNYSRHHQADQRWISGTISRQIGQVTFIVRLEDSEICVKRHKNQMRHRVPNRIPELEASSTPIEDDTSQLVNSTEEPRYPTRRRRPPQRFAEENWTNIFFKGERM